MLIQRIRTVLFAVFAASLIVSCSTPSSVPFTNYTVFTEDIRKDLEGAGIPLSSVQFYNDKAIIIKREGVNPNDINVTAEGKISIQNGKSVHTINLRPFTPGILLTADDGSMNVSWDDSQQDAVGIKFNLNGNQYYMNTTDDAKLLYKNSTDDIQTGIGSRLFVNKDIMKQVNKESQILKGRKVGQ
jgi:hypothetical protein